MIFCVEEETAADFQFDAVSVGEAVASAVLADAGCPFEAEVTLLLTDEAGIRALNRQNRGIDAATDVLSFPAFAFETPADFTAAAAEAHALNPENGAVWLGDIAISVPRVSKQAADYGHAVKREFAFLIAHAMLHLIGYDHADEASAARMEETQERILYALHLTRDMAEDA